MLVIESKVNESRTISSLGIPVYGVTVKILATGKGGKARYGVYFIDRSGAEIKEPSKRAS